MNGIRKILLATNRAQQPGRAELRAAMLSAQLNARSIEMIAVKHARLGMGTPATSFSHTEIGSNTLCAWVEGKKHQLSLPLCPDTIEKVWTVQAGTPAAIVVERAAQIEADLTIVAPYRKHFLLEWFRPSDNSEIVRMSRRPVLLVNNEPRNAYKKVLVATDFSEESLAAARTALLAAPSAHFTFLHAYRLPDEGVMRELEVAPAVINSYRVRGCETARGCLNEWIDRIGPRTQLISRAVHYGFPVPLITACAKRIGADLIVIGKHGKTPFRRGALGNVAQRLANQADYDVLIGSPQQERDWDDRPAA